ncbi:hypothetical protein D6783_05925 [Candidatus Woesearchaeota archaeon]|nr:MAG: hypothetical protein D6783_05925 [Candidatus Woesearchaeota archaeon]
MSTLQNLLQKINIHRVTPLDEALRHAELVGEAVLGTKMGKHLFGIDVSNNDTLSILLDSHYFQLYLETGGTRHTLKSYAKDKLVLSQRWALTRLEARQVYRQLQERNVKVDFYDGISKKRVPPEEFFFEQEFTSNPRSEL